MTETTSQLKTLKVINRLEIKERKRSGRDARSVPKYGVWSPDGRLLQNFRRLSHACGWAAVNRDYVKVKVEDRR